MNKKVLFGIIAILLVFASCDKYKDVKLFVSDFASAIEKGDTATIEQMYPDVIAADSLTITYNADSVFIEPSMAENQYEVKLNDEQSVLVEKDQEGQFHVLESKGLFAYDAKLKEFYQALGCYDSAFNDKKNSEQMRDSAFIDYVNSICAEKIQSGIRLETKMIANEYFTQYNCVVHNETGFDLPKNSYVLTVKDYVKGDGPASLISTEMLSDQDINKDDAVVFVSIKDHGNQLYTFAVWTFNLKKHDMVMLQKLYAPTGKEYQEYLQTKK